MKNYKLIELSQGLVAVVDACKFRELNKFSWYASRSQGKNRKLGEPYAATLINKKKVYMHRLLLGNPKDMVVDHINHQTLDNRLENLRVLSPDENRRHRIDRKKTCRRK